jgi:hypothetical protein
MRTTSTAMLLHLTQALDTFMHAGCNGLFVCRSLVKGCEPLNRALRLPRRRAKDDISGAIRLSLTGETYSTRATQIQENICEA